MLSNHGGVCLIHDASFHVRLVSLPNYSSFEVIAAYVHRAGFNAVVVVVYRPGSSGATQAFFNDFSDLLERLATYSTPLMITGDFNIHVDDANSTDAGKLSDILAGHSLLQHINSPTHRLGHTLDLFITRDDQLIKILPIDPPLLSDHAFVVVDCDCTPPSDMSSNMRYVRNWRSLDVDAFAADLGCSDLLLTALPDDVVSAFNCYNTTLTALLDKHAPLEPKRVGTRPSAPWYDSECRDAKRWTRKLERRYRCRHTAETLAAWCGQFDSQRQLYQTKYTTFWLTKIEACERDPRALWRAVNTLLQPPKQQVSPKLSADNFASFFREKVATIRASTASARPPDISVRQAPQMHSFEPATVHEIVKLMNTTPSKSCPLDPIPTWLLKCLTVHIAPVICHLCNMSLENGLFPGVLKQARVLPLLKKSTMDPDIASSYRPISNLPYLSKLVERVVANRFKAHVSNSSLLPVQQSAYRSFHSTETAVLSVHNDLVRSVDSGHVSSLVLLDLSAAFDTVDHQTLLTVLSRRFAVTGTALNWFASYLCGRSQTFSYAGKETSRFPVDCSVPQGSVLGPLEFVAYTEDVVDLVDRHDIRSHLYADDSQLYTSCLPADVDAVRTRLSNCSADMIQWCASRRLQLNANKTEVIWFGSRSNLNKLSRCDLSVKVGCEVIQPSHVVRNLGVHLDAQLSMKQHIAKVAAACFYHLRRLRQIRRRVGKEVTVRLVLALVTPRLDYCNSMLAGLPQITLEPLQRVQNAAVRLIFDLGPRDHVTSSLLQLHWLPIRWRIEYKLCTLMYSVHTGRCPAYLSDITQCVAYGHPRPGLRSAASNKYVTPRLRTKFGERAFSHAGPAAWNALPAYIRDEPDSAAFKRRLKKHFFCAAF